MSFLKRNWQNKAALFGAMAFATASIAGCSSSAPTVVQSTYEVSGCSEEPTTAKVTHELMEKGYLHESDRRGAYDVFHKPRIEKAGMLASEPFVDKSGDFGVASCSPAKIFAVSELRSCAHIRDCTSKDQAVVGDALKKFGCTVSVNTRRTRSWQLESRHDWSPDSCGQIVSQLRIK